MLKEPQECSGKTNEDQTSGDYIMTTVQDWETVFSKPQKYVQVGDN